MSCVCCTMLSQSTDGTDRRTNGRHARSISMTCVQNVAQKHGEETWKTQNKTNVRAVRAVPSGIKESRVNHSDVRHSPGQVALERSDAIKNAAITVAEGQISTFSMPHWSVSDSQYRIRDHGIFCDPGRLWRASIRDSDLSCHCLLHHVITIHQRFRQTDEWTSCS